MAFGKWIGGFLGFCVSGPLGALAGYFIGSVIDAAASANVETRIYDGVSDDGQAEERRQWQGQRNSFLFSLMVLASYAIQADGRIMHSEMEYVRQFLRRSFGEAAVTQGEAILNGLFAESKKHPREAWRRQIQDVCGQLRQQMPEAQRLQLLTFLIEISKADGRVVQAEVDVLRELAQWLGVGAQVVDQLDNLDGNTLEAAYRLLGVSASATDDEVRKAYRQMALKYHPDRVAKLGDDVRRNAEETFKKINEAKEKIFAARGMR